MKSVSATASSGRGMALAGIFLATSLLVGACSNPLKPAAPPPPGAPAAKAGAAPQAPRAVVTETLGDSTLQVTQTDEDGGQVVRITLRRGAETHTLLLRLDDPLYQITIPVNFNEAAPSTSRRPGRPPEIEFQDLLIAQYLERAKEFSRSGDYKEALRQVDLVLLTRPDYIRARAARGSILYAMGDTTRAVEEWERVLKVDPENQEVRAFMEFLKSNKGGQEPPLP